MKPIVTLVSGFGWHVEDLRRAAGRLGARLEAVPFPSLEGTVGSARDGTSAGTIRLEDAGAVLVRMMPPGSLEQVVFRMDALHRLEAGGVPVVNPPRAVEAAVDKYLALAKLAAAGLPVPPTWTGESADAAMTSFDVLGGDVVIKPLFGSEGRGLVRVSDREVAWRVAHAIERIGAVIYMQSYLHHAGHDLRVFVLAGRVLGAIRRHAAASAWRTNVAQGGRAEAVAVDAEAERLALRAAGAIGARVAGVDILADADGRPFVVEVNAVPGWRALAAATGIDVAAAIVDDVRGLAR